MKRIMITTIERCTQCDYGDDLDDRFNCSKKDMVVVPNENGTFVIPEWCPLPKA